MHAYLMRSACLEHKLKIRILTEALKHTVMRDCFPYVSICIRLFVYCHSLAVGGVSAYRSVDRSLILTEVAYCYRSVHSACGMLPDLLG